MKRKDIELRYFFNPGFDENTGECDLEGTDVYYKGIFAGEIKWTTPDELEKLDDFELEDVFFDNGIRF